VAFRRFNISPLFTRWQVIGLGGIYYPYRAKLNPLRRDSHYICYPPRPLISVCSIFVYQIFLKSASPHFLIRSSEFSERKSRCLASSCPNQRSQCGNAADQRCHVWNVDVGKLNAIGMIHAIIANHLKILSVCTKMLIHPMVDIRRRRLQSHP